MLWFRINYSRNWECFDQSCANRPETVHGTLRFLYLSHLLYRIFVKIFLHVPYESVYFKELHNEQECYWPTIYRAGAAVVSTITSFSFRVINMLALPSRFCCAFISTGNKITKTVIAVFRTSMVDWSSSGNRQCVRNFFELDLLTKISENNTRRYLWWRKNKLKET